MLNYVSYSDQRAQMQHNYTTEMITPNIERQHGLRNYYDPKLQVPSRFGSALTMHIQQDYTSQINTGPSRLVQYDDAREEQSPGPDTDSDRMKQTSESNTTLPMIAPKLQRHQSNHVAESQIPASQDTDSEETKTLIGNPHPTTHWKHWHSTESGFDSLDIQGLPIAVPDRKNMPRLTDPGEDLVCNSRLICSMILSRLVKGSYIHIKSLSGLIARCFRIRDPERGGEWDNEARLSRLLKDHKVLVDGYTMYCLADDKRQSAWDQERCWRYWQTRDSTKILYLIGMLAGASQVSPD